MSNQKNVLVIETMITEHSEVHSHQPHLHQFASVTTFLNESFSGVEIKTKKRLRGTLTYAVIYFKNAPKLYAKIINSLRKDMYTDNNKTFWLL